MRRGLNVTKTKKIFALESLVDVASSGWCGASVDWSCGRCGRGRVRTDADRCGAASQTTWRRGFSWLAGTVSWTRSNLHHWIWIWRSSTKRPKTGGATERNYAGDLTLRWRHGQSFAGNQSRPKYGSLGVPRRSGRRSGVDVVDGVVAGILLLPRSVAEVGVAAGASVEDGVVDLARNKNEERC